MQKASAYKKLFLCLILGSSIALLLNKATSPLLPGPENKVVFYSNQTRQDLKLLFCEALRKAKHSIHACFYGITDRDLIALFSKKASSGVAVSIEYDKRASLQLRPLLPTIARCAARTSKGLMHQKILIIDKTSLYLGSANLTPSSLRHHSNFVLGLHCPSLAAFLLEPNERHFSFSLDTGQGECLLLPDNDKYALQRLLSLIDSATQSIRVALFTLTHPEIAKALINAKNRGINVSVIVDSYSGKGASKKTIDLLNKGGVHTALSRGPQLLHHKWALIDEETLIIGSANWTKAAFTKNEDYLIILSPLDSKQRRFLMKLWTIIDLESDRI